MQGRWNFRMSMPVRRRVNYRFGINTIDKRYDFFEDYPAMVNSICEWAARNKVKIKILE